MHFVNTHEDGVFASLGVFTIIIVFGILLSAEKTTENKNTYQKSEFMHAAPDEFRLKGLAKKERTSRGTNKSIFSEYAENSQINENSKAFNVDGSIVVLDLDSSEVISIPTDKKIIEAKLSPDKKNITFLALENGNTEIFLLDTQTREKKCLTFDSSRKSNLVFSADSSRILFTSNLDRSEGEIYSINLDGRKQKRITNNSLSEKSFDVSGKGSIVFSAFENGNQELFLLANGTSINITNSIANERSPKFSSNDKDIVYIKDVEEKSEIFTMGINGEYQTRITDNMLKEENPEFYENNKKIIFWADGSLFEILADGSGEDEKEVDLGNM